ncbi:MAG: hypothetical protein JW759_07715 [Candidatus Coatesbacteria bacterium]|nr:hypothetical protein [Candidatus Coatesbacteria bacterium]
MKVEIEGRRFDTTRGALLQMARRHEVQPWFYVKSDELTGGKWVKAGELQLFAGAWGDSAKEAHGAPSSQPPIAGVGISSQKLHPSSGVGKPFVGQAKGPVAAAASGHIDLHGFRVDYRIACPKCANALTKLGAPKCPRCGARLAASKQLHWAKKVLYAVCMLVFFAGTLFLKELGEWAKVLYPAAGILLSVMSVIGRGAKLTVALSIKGRSMPPKDIVIPLSEYYSPNAWNKLVERIKSVFRLDAVLRKMSEDDSPNAAGFAAPERF